MPDVVTFAATLGRANASLDIYLLLSMDLSSHQKPERGAQIQSTSTIKANSHQPSAGTKHSTFASRMVAVSFSDSWYDEESESECHEEFICIEPLCQKLLSQSSEATLDTLVTSESSATCSISQDVDEEESTWSWFTEGKETIVRFSDVVNVVEFDQDDDVDYGNLFYSAEDFDAFREEYRREVNEDVES